MRLGSRRPFRRARQGACVLLLSLGLGWVNCVAAPHNILLIIADDYGADSSALYNSTATGASLPPTPNLAALAQRGVIFRNAYAHPVCSPTRASLLTGRHPFRTGIGNAIGGTNSVVLQAAEFTLPEAFAANPSRGYQLAQFGKWHLHNGPDSPNAIGGWPHYAGGLSGTLANYTNWTKTVNGTTTTNYPTYVTTDVVNDALAWIAACGPQPWFAWVAFNAGHTPLHKPPAALSPHYADLPGTPADITARPRPYFEAMIEAMDTEIGRLVAAVAAPDTHIIFLGDNGTAANVLQSPYPAGRGKGTLYEGGTRVPFLIAGSAVANPGRTNEALVHAADLFATILELAGINVATTVPTHRTVDSRSLLPLLSGQSNGSRTVYTEQFGAAIATSKSGRALRDERYKLLQFTDGHAEFYDLQTDPCEGTDLLATILSEPQQQCHDRLAFWLAGYGTNGGPSLGFPEFAGGRCSVSVSETVGASYALWRCDDPVAAFWAPVGGTLVGITNALVTLTDPAPPAARAFYSVVRSP